MNDNKKTPDEWLATDEFCGTVIYDPIGWDRSNLTIDWMRPLTHGEFHQKLFISTAWSGREWK